MSVSGINVSTGLGNGLDVTSTVDLLIQGASGPLSLMQNQQQLLQAEGSTISSLASILSDIQTKANSLSDISGALSGMTTTSSNPSVVTASADTTAQAGKHTLIVTSLATGSSSYTKEETSATATLGAGSFSIQIGPGSPTPIIVPAGSDTLSGIAGIVNGMNLGIQATVVQDSGGARLALAGTSTGANTDFTISNDTIGLGWTKSSTGSDASFSVDGVPLKSATNNAANVLPGVTFTLLSAAPGQSISISVAPDTQATQNALQNFVSSYNSLTKSINAQFSVDSTTEKAGILSGDISLRQVQQQMLSEVAMSGSGSSFATLRDIGLEMQDDGTLKINQSTLTDALTNHFTDVKSMFQGTGGYGQKLNADLTQLNDPAVGLLNADNNGINSQLKNVADQIQSFNDYLASQRTAWTAEYTKISVMMQQEPSQLAQIQSALGIKTA